MRSIRWISVMLLAALFFGVTAGAQAAPQAQSGSGEICVLAFEDQDGNSVKGSDEPLLGGVGFTLSDESGVKSTWSTDGNSEPYCFGNLPPAQYTVQARGPANLEVTTAGQWAVPLAAGARFDVAWGAQKTGGTAAANNSSGGGSSMTTFGRIVLGGVGLLVLIGAGFLAMTTLQRARASR